MKAHTIIFRFHTHEVIWRSKGKDVEHKYRGLTRNIYDVTVCPGNRSWETVAYPNTSNSVRFIKKATE